MSVYLDRLLRRQTARRSHPTLEEALAALERDTCLYWHVSCCSGEVRAIGLRYPDDRDTVPICRAHARRLRQMPKRQLDQLQHERLREAFDRWPKRRSS